MSEVREPYVGADVHYIGPGVRLTFAHRAAKVVEVAAEGGTVTLAVFNPKKLVFLTGVSYGEKRGQWHWPEPPVVEPPE
jgi:hypothetical protein